ncbi:MAG: hypothetical protein ACYTXY_12465, partial [Nostoc sp.]
MATKRPARKGNPDLRQQKHLPAPPIAEIEKEIFSLLSPVSFKPLRLYEDKQKKKFRDTPFKVVKFGTKIGYFNLQKTQNLSRGLKMVALKQGIFVCHLE